MENQTPAEQSLQPTEGMEVVQSKKRKVKQLLPVDDTYIYQSNKVTLSRYSTTLLLERLLTLIQYELQEAVKLSMRGDSNYHKQLDLFNPENNLIEIRIPLRSITKANSLTDAIATANSLMDLKISYPSFKENGKTQYLSIRQAVHGVDIPIKSETEIKKGKNKGSTRRNMDQIIISLTKDQADRFVLVDYDSEKKVPIKYTKYLLQTAYNAKTKYTSRMYKLIASWAVKKKFSLNFDWLKEHLDIKGNTEDGKPFDLYPYYSDFKKRVLEPVYKELYRKSDCWFEYAPGLVQGKKVVKINFVVVTPELEKLQDRRREDIRHLLRTHYDFDSIDFKGIKGIFASDVDPEAVVSKLVSMHQTMLDKRQKGEDIGNKKAWAVTCLKNFLTTGK